MGKSTGFFLGTDFQQTCVRLILSQTRKDSNALMARETCAVFHKMVWLGRRYTTLPAQCVYTKDGFPAEIMEQPLNIGPVVKTNSYLFAQIIRIVYVHVCSLLTYFPTCFKCMINSETQLGHDFTYK